MELRDASEAESQLLAELLSERYIHELLMLYEIGQSLCSIHDLDRLLRFSIERVVTLLGVESSAVMLLDEERQELYFKVADNIHSDMGQKFQELRFPADQGIAGWVVREGVSALVSDVEQDSRFYRGVDKQTGMKTKSYLCVPLKTKDRILGALSAVNKRKASFSEDDVRLLEFLAGPLAIAIENARLIQELQTAQERLREHSFGTRLGR
ncbi:MAG TPA: GAF domain-containing protein [Candidatus Binatia bacterium]|nr:GAF domain-containing protein [Candidatus Binatia bacterium]